MLCGIAPVGLRAMETCSQLPSTEMRGLGTRPLFVLYLLAHIPRRSRDYDMNTDASEG